MSLSKYNVRAMTRLLRFSAPELGIRGYKKSSPGILYFTQRGKMASHRPKIEVFGDLAARLAVAASLRRHKTCIVHLSLITSIAV